ncbi:hypothetical protein Nmel_016370 [Mimus melanotis]
MHGSAHGLCCWRSVLEPAQGHSDHHSYRQHPWCAQLLVIPELQAFLDWFSFLSLVCSVLLMTNLSIKERGFVLWSRWRCVGDVLGNDVLSEFLAWP